MKFRFWGVRGSLPHPLSPEALKAKVSSIINRIRPADLSSPDSRELFMSGLPPELFGLVGGNTTCLEVEGTEDDVLVVDGGTGLRELGVAHEFRHTKAKHYHLFFSHFHWDHIQGLPFFSGLFRAQNRVTFYSTVQGFEAWIREQMNEPFFPVPLSVALAKIAFVELVDQPLVIGGVNICWKAVNHPGGCTSYRFERHGHSLVFSTDTELRVMDFVKSDSNQKFYGGIDVLVMDAQYTLGEAVERPDWGHSSSSLAVDFALDFGVKRLYLFHHEPTHDDAKIEEIGRLAQWYADHKSPGSLEVRIAKEGREEDMT